MKHSKVIVALLCGVLFANCTASLPVRTFRTQEDAGTVHVAVQSMAAFDEDFINQLQTPITITDDQAAIALTTVRDVQRFRAFLAEMGIGLPTDTSTFTKDLAADGTKTVTGKEERKPGDAASIPTPPAGVSQTTSPFAPSEAKIAIDESLRIRALMALRQEAALLNRQIRDAAISRGTKPYVLRFLVTLSPTARREPYNTFASISLFAAKGEQELPREVESFVAAIPAEQQLLHALAKKTQDYCSGSVEMVPLFVTDNLESSADTTALQSVLSVGAGAGGLIQNIVARVAARFQSNDQQRAKGTGFNALYTVGRVSTNTIEARLGAFTSGVDFEAVPRTYNVTVLALVPTLGRLLDDEGDSIATAATRASLRRLVGDLLACRELAFTSLYRFTDGRNGHTLKSRFDKLSARELERVKTNWRMNDVTVEDLSRLMTFANIDDFDSFRKALERNPSNDATPLQSAATKVSTGLRSTSPTQIATSGALAPKDHLALTQMFWSDLVNVARRSGRAYGRISVPSSAFALFGLNNPATLIDDGEAKATVTISGASDLTSTALEGRLALDENHTFYAKNVTVSKDGRRATFEFDSPKRFLGSAPTKLELTVERAGGGRAFQSPIQHRYVAAIGGDGKAAARLTYLKTPEKKEEPKPEPVPALMSVTSEHILLASDGQSGSIAVAFAPRDPKKPQRVRVSVKGADLVSVAPEMAADGLDFVGAASRTYVLQLRNIAVNDLVTIIAFVDKDDARGAEVGRQTVRVADFSRSTAPRVSRTN
jgi:hypothetical protein